MIVDEILFELRRFKEAERGRPKLVKLSPEEYAELVEYYGLYDRELTRFHGMEIEVSEEFQLTLE